MSRGALLRTLDTSLAAARRRPRRPVAGAHLVRRGPARGDAVRARRRRVVRSGALRRHLQLLRLADRAGRDAPAGRAGPRPARLDPGGVLAAPARHRARGVPAAEALGLGHPALVAARARGAHRQVPHRHPGRLARRVTAVRAVRRRATSTPRSAQVVEAVCRAAEGLDLSPVEVALAWVRDQPGVTAPIVGARTAAQLAGSPHGRGRHAARGDRRRARRRVGARRWATRRPERHAVSPVACSRRPLGASCRREAAPRARGARRPAGSCRSSGLVPGRTPPTAGRRRWRARPAGPSARARRRARPAQAYAATSQNEHARNGCSPPAMPSTPVCGAVAHHQPVADAGPARRRRSCRAPAGRRPAGSRPRRSGAATRRPRVVS